MEKSKSETEPAISLVPGICLGKVNPGRTFHLAHFSHSPRLESWHFGQSSAEMLLRPSSKMLHHSLAESDVDIFAY